MRLKVEEAVRQALDKTRGHEVADKESACNCLDCHDAWASVFAHPDFNLYGVLDGSIWGGERGWAGGISGHTAREGSPGESEAQGITWQGVGKPGDGGAS